jgi:hypothetical protein
VNDRSRIALAACLGALAGGVAGYLFLTEDGRRVRERLGPGMGDLAQEVLRLRGAVDSARVAAREGWAAVEDLRRSTPDTKAGWDGPARPPSMA